MNTPLNRSLRGGILFLIALGGVACQTPKPGTAPAGKPTATGATQSEEERLKQRELAQLTLCQEQMGALRKITPKQHQQYQQAFDGLMQGAAQYARVRVQVNENTQETMDALYRYKINYLCANVSQAVLTGLAERVELGKEEPVK
ncbi:Uncharacterised protein [Serratia fonticola]|uniref:Uncharacterized protein n=1 Tax=Serratia fonticola TaxID=47917 RepID=A0A0F7H744_SERFO|nr:hypothetical protein [Serratia fonticola]AKG68303.1 hypothetical protein WN53_03730 [Serratia fonticola]CAI1531159.1 Uncharacterised protein [Serratia fonticola]VTR51677.1 Uncharacterised protein [Serratia fonticola]